jgi:E3 ubiquitin-protein ligase mind-bomb
LRLKTHQGEHFIKNPFLKISRPFPHRVEMKSRKNSVPVELKGIFAGAKVCRGANWNWGDQDGGEGKTGWVVEIQDWQKESCRSVASVAWETNTTNVYRVGHKGQVDLMALEHASGGFYYEDHLPLLGTNYVIKN